MTEQDLLFFDEIVYFGRIPGNYTVCLVGIRDPYVVNVEFQHFVSGSPAHAIERIFNLTLRPQEDLHLRSLCKESSLTDLLQKLIEEVLPLSYKVVFFVASRLLGRDWRDIQPWVPAKQGIPELVEFFVPPGNLDLPKAIVSLDPVHIVLATSAHHHLISHNFNKHETIIYFDTV